MNLQIEETNTTATGTMSKGMEAYVPKPLAETFVLGENDVICGRGSRCFNYVGNVKFRQIVEAHLEKYSSAMTKFEKTSIICDIVNIVRQRSPHGGFVKRDPETGRYYEVGDFHAREKTSQAFRDLMLDRYKSSNFTKKIRRMVQKSLSASSVNDLKSRQILRHDEHCSEVNANFHGSFNLPGANTEWQYPEEVLQEQLTELQYENQFIEAMSEPQKIKSCPNLIPNSNRGENPMSLGVNQFDTSSFKNGFGGVPSDKSSQAMKQDVIACGSSNMLLAMLKHKKNLRREKQLDDDERTFNLLLQYSGQFPLLQTDELEPEPILETQTDIDMTLEPLRLFEPICVYNSGGSA